MDLSGLNQPNQSPSWSHQSVDSVRSPLHLSFLQPNQSPEQPLTPPPPPTPSPPLTPSQVVDTPTTKQMHMFFFPLLSPSHMLPALNMAKVFSYRGVKATIITIGPLVPMFENPIKKSRDLGLDISVVAINSPTAEAALPVGIESMDKLKSDPWLWTFFMATTKLQDPLEQLLQEFHPHCLVADKFFPWATDAAAKFGIPRLLFHGSSSFAFCVGESLGRHRPCVSSDSEPFLVPDLPHEIKMTKGQVSRDKQNNDTETEMSKFFQQVRDSDSKCFGVVVNSFYDLEPEYVDYTKKLGRRAWHVGPFMLCNKEVDDKAQKGKQCLEWLDSKEPDSVVYVCLSDFTVAQLQEIAKGLEGSGQYFIWVVRKCVDEEDSKKWFPQGFVERTEGRGLIIKGWAPQLLILRHNAVGAFVTHCGWNSTLEGVCSGVPLVTWPLFAEQFMNEKLLTDVLKIGVGVGAQQWSRVTVDTVKGEALANAVSRIMVGEEALEIRARSKALKEKARKAVEAGGSSYSDLNALIKDLSDYHAARTQE